ncbi:MAG TPA: hypothetical protein VGH50_08135 [Candidatus Binatia bacterium]|jgi:hypothetical protein
MDEEIRSYCRSKGFHLHTEARWLGYNEADRSALLQVIREVRPGENHFKDLLDWLEEIALRDGTPIAALLQKQLSGVLSDPRLARNDKLKRLKEELRRLRFPRLAGIEDEIQHRIRSLKLPRGISLSVPQGLEGGAVALKIEATRREDLRRLAADVSRAVDSDDMKEIFAILESGTAGA